MVKKISLYSAFIVFTSLCIIAIFANYIAPYDPLQTDLLHIGEPPSKSYIFGSDLLGRDLFSNIVYALRVSLIVGFFSAFLNILFSCIFVLLSLIKPIAKPLDMFLDICLSLPSLLIIMFALSLFGGSILTMSIIIALSHWPFSARTVIAEFKKLKHSDFYIASIACGATKLRAFIKDIIPAISSLLLVLFIINFAHAIGTEALLSFFGLGVQGPSFGYILNSGVDAILNGAWFIIFFPCLFIFLLIISLFGLSMFFQDYFGIRL